MPRPLPLLLAFAFLACSRKSESTGPTQVKVEPSTSVSAKGTPGAPPKLSVVAESERMLMIESLGDAVAVFGGSAVAVAVTGADLVFDPMRVRGSDGGCLRPSQCSEEVIVGGVWPNATYLEVRIAEMRSSTGWMVHRWETDRWVAKPNRKDAIESYYVDFAPFAGGALGLELHGIVFDGPEEPPAALTAALAKTKPRLVPLDITAAQTVTPQLKDGMAAMGLATTRTGGVHVLLGAEASLATHVQSFGTNDTVGKLIALPDASAATPVDAPGIFVGNSGVYVFGSLGKDAYLAVGRDSVWARVDVGKSALGVDDDDVDAVVELEDGTLCALTRQQSGAAAHVLLLAKGTKQWKPLVLDDVTTKTPAGPAEVTWDGKQSWVAGTPKPETTHTYALTPTDLTLGGKGELWVAAMGQEKGKPDGDVSYFVLRSRSQAKRAVLPGGEEIARRRLDFEPDVPAKPTDRCDGYFLSLAEPPAGAPGDETKWDAAPVIAALAKMKPNDSADETRLVQIADKGKHPVGLLLESPIPIGLAETQGKNLRALGEALGKVDTSLKPTLYCKFPIVDRVLPFSYAK